MSPMDRSLYPLDWPAISRRIRGRSGGRCECKGECGKDHGYIEHPWSSPPGYVPGEARCFMENGCSYTNVNTGRETVIVLTVAHLNHTPADCRDSNLLALCQRCHLALDRDLHTKNSTKTRREKKDAAHEAAGQGRLL